MTLKPIQIFITLAVILLLTGLCHAQEGDSAVEGEMSTMHSLADIIKVIDKATSTGTDEKPAEWTTPVKLVIIFTCIALVPTLLVMTTSFTRIIIVLSFVRRALATQSIPPNTAVVGLALFLTIYTMAPTFKLINEHAIEPYIAEEIEFNDAAVEAGDIIKGFMIRQARQSDVALFVNMSKSPQPQSPADIPLHVIVPAFIISEFRTAFEIGCLMFIPFLLLDLVVASILLSAGMMMLPPVMISLPFKLILFILVDGWGILSHSLSLSFK